MIQAAVRVMSEALRLATVALVLLAVAPVWAQNWPDACDCPTGVRKRLKAHGFLTNTKAVELCSPATAKDNTCTLDVVITQQSKSSCRAALNYCVACIDKQGQKSFQPTLIWRLVAGDEKVDLTKFEFRPADGIDMPAAQVPGNPGFKDNKWHDASGQQYQWVAGDRNSKQGGYRHQAIVRFKDGGVSCFPVDPIAVNTGN